MTVSQEMQLLTRYQLIEYFQNPIKYKNYIILMMNTDSS